MLSAAPSYLRNRSDLVFDPWVARCLVCGIEVRVGSLCRDHARALAKCEDITAEQIRSRGPERPPAWLIDQWGHTHPLSALALVGRSAEDCAVAILHHSVSALHAQIEQSTGTWRLLDRGSLNGTWLNDQRVRDVQLGPGDRVGFGDVCFFFAVGPLHAVQGQPGTGRTVPTRSKEVAFTATLTREGVAAIELHQRAMGGIARRQEASTSLEFARLEFALLVVLAERKLRHPDPELCFVSSQELADQLEFKSRDADGENVRELVRRVRKKLKSEGIEDLIESRQGVGYRLAWDIQTA
jgi:hypothetical protein